MVSFWFCNDQERKRSTKERSCLTVKGKQLKRNTWQILTLLLLKDRSSYICCLLFVDAGRWCSVFFGARRKAGVLFVCGGEVRRKLEEVSRGFIKQSLATGEQKGGDYALHRPIAARQACDGAWLWRVNDDNRRSPLLEPSRVTRLLTA